MVVHFQKGQAVTTLSTELSCGCALSEWLGCDNFRQCWLRPAAAGPGASLRGEAGATARVKAPLASPRANSRVGVPGEPHRQAGKDMASDRRNLSGSNLYGFYFEPPFKQHHASSSAVMKMSATVHVLTVCYPERPTVAYMSPSSFKSPGSGWCNEMR